MEPGSGKRPARGGDSVTYGDAIDIKNLIGIVRRRKLIVLWTVCLITSVAALAAALIMPRYTATSAVLIQPRAAQVIDLDAVVGDLAPDEAMVETQIEVLASRELAEQVVQELGLLSDPEFNPAIAEEVDRSLAIAGWLHDYWPTLEGIADELLPEMAKRPLAQNAAELPAAHQLETAVTVFLEKLEVRRGGRSYVLSIDFTSTDPENAARVANAVVRSYVDTQLADKLSATTEATRWLTERVEQLRDQVLEAERAVEDYRVVNQLVDSPGTTLNVQQLVGVNATLIATRAERAEKEARLERVREVVKSGGGYDGIAEVMSSPVIVMLREQETTLLRQKAQLSREYGERHPRMVHLAVERQDLAARIDLEARNIIRTLESEVTVARRRERALEESLNETKGQSAVIGRAGIQLAELEREAAANRVIYETFLTRLKETREQEDLLRPDARVISAAFVPDEPSFPTPKLMVVSGFTASLMMGLLLAFLAEHLDRSLRTGSHLEELLGVASLGLVPSVRRFKRLQKHRYLLEKPLSEYAEAIRSVRKALQLSNIDRPPQVVMVTSTLPGEGKTTLATSLAASGAASGCNTILVDLDLRHPSVAREMNQPVRADLIDFMTGRATLDEVIYADPTADRLAYIPIKQLTRSPLNLLESQKMVSLIAALRARYDYIVLDTPPALGITDARATAVLADAVLFVVRWQQTKAEPALSALEILLNSHARVAGAVLTQVNLRRLAKLAYGDSGQYYKRYKTYYQE